MNKEDNLFILKEFTDLKLRVGELEEKHESLLKLAEATSNNMGRVVGVLDLLKRVLNP